MKRIQFFFFSCIVFVLFCISSPVYAGFVDVSQDAVFYPAINYYQRMGIVQGDNNYFFPDKAVRRIEFIKILIGSIDTFEDLSYIKIPYQDLTENEWYAPYVKLALKKGILHSATLFYPNDSLSLLEAIQYIYRYYKNVVLPPTGSAIFQFGDVNKFSQSAYLPALEQAYQDKLISPVSETKLGVYHGLSRADAAVLLYNAKRLYQYTDNGDAIPLENYLFGKVSPELKEMFLDVYQKIHNEYLYKDNIDDTALLYATLEGMVRGLKDPYSVFMPPEASQTFIQSVQGDVEGIGAYVEMVNGLLKIVAPLKNSPAEKARLLPDDTIVSIDGIPTADMTLNEAVSKIRGPTGTSVKLEILRKGLASTLMVEIIREKIKVESVDFKLVGNGIPYFSIIQFLPSTPSEFTTLYEKNIINTPRAIILDLRNNPGGYLDSALYFLGNFLKPEEIAVRIRSLTYTDDKLSYGDGKLATIPLIVLMNKGSASASEIVASALQDYKRGVIVGEKSFGKGLVQQLYEFSQGASLKLTIYEWLPPLSPSINKIGVTPNIEVKNDPATPAVDAQLTKALEQAH